MRYPARHPPEFDSNDDGRLELSELRRLCDLVGKQLSDAELKEAIKLLGTKDSTYVYFNDFAGGAVGGRLAESVGPHAWGHLVDSLQLCESLAVGC